MRNGCVTGAWRQGAHTHHPIVTEQSKQVAATVPDTAFVSAAGLEDRGDHVHFTTQGYISFGARYAAKWLQLQPPPAE